jgi:hypothetical protein
MNPFARVLGSAVFLVGIAACASSPADTAIKTPRQANQCKIAATQCRWDAQCCSGRCYVDTGCSG